MIMKVLKNYVSMEQVGKKMIHKILISLLISLFLLGCTHQNNMEYSSKEYKGVNKDALLNAAKTVIKLSDKSFAIDSRRTSIKATKISPIHKGFTVDINVNTIDLMVFPDENITRAKVKFTHKNNILAKNSKILQGDIHTLFWERVDYILGLRKDWHTCAEHRLKLNYDGILCDIVHNENTSPNENDIIKNIGFNTLKKEKENQIKLVDINLTTMKNIELPIEINNDLNITEEINSSTESNITIQLKDDETIDENLSHSILDINNSDNNISLLDENISTLEDIVLDDNTQDIFDDEVNASDINISKKEY